MSIAGAPVGQMDTNTMKPQLPHVLFSLLPLFALPAHADIYKCADPDGHVTYSNVQSSHCKKLNLEPVSTVPAAKPAAKAPTPANFPRVDENQQKSRDGDRRRILESELAAEQKNLDEAKKALAEQEVPRNGEGRASPRAQDLRNSAALHERNIEAIRKEIANLK